MDTAVKRIANFESYVSHPWLHKQFKRLKKDELELARAFLKDNGQLPKGEFEFAVNRMFLDQPQKPKHFTIILDLLTCANSAI